MSEKTLASQKALEYFGKSMYEEVVKVYLSTGENDSLDLEDMYLLSRSLCELEFYEKAYPLLVKVTSKKLPTSMLAMAHYSLAKCSFHTTGNEEEVLINIESAIKYNPSNEKMMLYAAEVYLAFEKFSLGKKACECARKLGGSKYKISQIEARIDYESETRVQTSENLDIGFNCIKKIIPPSQKTILLNLGFAKCGSTFLQSVVWPNMPFEKYSYLGIHYKRTIKSRLERGYAPHFSSKDFYGLVQKAPNSSDAKQKFLSLLEKEFESNDLLCFSAELLPDFQSAISVNQLLRELLPEVKIIHLLFLRPPLEVAWSGYSHKMLGRIFFQRDLVTFDEYYGKQMYSKSEDFQYVEIAKKYFDAVEGLKISSEMKSLSNSSRLWSAIFEALAGTYKVSESYSKEWLSVLNSYPKINKKTGIAEKLLSCSRDDISSEAKKLFAEWDASYYSELSNLDGFVH